MTATTKTLIEKLSAVQIALKAPKGQTNTFGGYKYRNCEDILEAVKPLLAEQGLTLSLSDQLEQIGERYYIKAVAMICMDRPDGIRTAEVTAYAREEETKKGMDGSQITGAASSYARKYALNGLFLIDDTKDSDATNEHGKAPAATATQSAPEPTSETPDLSVGKTALMNDFVAAGMDMSGAKEFVTKTLFGKGEITTVGELAKVKDALRLKVDRELGQMS